MREIIFRGKLRDGSKWAEGYLDTDKSKKLAFIRTPREVHTDVELVDPETVGQYTGLKDKNGKRIFEGDIVRHRYRPFREEVIAVVEYGEGCFCAHTLRSSNSPALDIVMNESDIEIIGNIHDNPELIGGAE